MECKDTASQITDPARLAALRAVALLDTPIEESFDRLTWLAASFTNAPVALVTLVDADRQFFKSCLGLSEPWCSLRETPLSHSFCSHNFVPRQPLVIEDARLHPGFKDNLAIQDLNVIAYLGIPLVTGDDYVLGSFCVIDKKPRMWTEEEIGVVEKLAASVMSEIHLRTEINARHEAESELRTRNDELHEAYLKLERESAERLRALEQLRQRDQVLIQQGRLTAMGEMISNIAHQWRQPLNILALLAQELPMTLKSGEFHMEYLEGVVAKMMREIRHLSATIDNFRTFFRPAAEKSEFHVVEAVRKTLSLLEDSLRESDIETPVTAVADPVVHGYRNEYCQVLLHIVSNARDALVQRKVAAARITIEVGSAAGHSVVTIADNAGGIAEEIRERIFDPYFTTKGPDKGSGIGLFLAKMIIEKNMSGSLTVSNVPGGASFRIEV